MLTVLKKIVLWDHFCQVLYVISTISSVILWIEGHATPWTGLWIGWNLGSALYWQFYLWQRQHTEEWIQRAMRHRVDPTRDMLQAVKDMVDARIRAHEIDPDRN